MPADPAQRSGLPIGALLLILPIVFINFASFSLIIPLLPFYGRELGASPVQVTMLFAAYSLGGVFGEVHWGRLSDRLGRRRILILTTACAALSYVAFAFVADYWLALGIRILSGFFGGTMGVCASYVADVTRPEERARSMGLLGVGINLTNPKVVLFFVTLLPQFVEAGDPHASGKLLFLGLYFVAFTAPLAALMILTAERVIALLRNRPRLLRAIDYGFAGLFSAFALRILVATR